jgi:hypothetical protein
MISIRMEKNPKDRTDTCVIDGTDAEYRINDDLTIDFRRRKGDAWNRCYIMSRIVVEGHAQVQCSHQDVTPEEVEACKRHQERHPDFFKGDPTVIARSMRMGIFEGEAEWNGFEICDEGDEDEDEV